MAVETWYFRLRQEPHNASGADPGIFRHPPSLSRQQPGDHSFERRMQWELKKMMYKPVRPQDMCSKTLTIILSMVNLPPLLLEIAFTQVGKTLKYLSSANRIWRARVGANVPVYVMTQ